MPIDLGGQPLGPKFRKDQIRRDPTPGFRQPAPYSPLTGHNEPLLPGEHNIRVCTIDEIADNHLSCSDQQDRVVLVAKSYLLRRTPFDGETHNGITYTYTSSVQRTADDGVDTETQIVIPHYVVGDEIIAIHLQNTGVEDDKGDALDYLDLNVDGRAWAKEAP